MIKFYFSLWKEWHTIGDLLVLILLFILMVLLAPLVLFMELINIKIR